MVFVYYVICGGIKKYIELECTFSEIISMIRDLGSVSTVCTSLPIFDSINGSGFEIASHNFSDSQWINKVKYI